MQCGRDAGHLAHDIGAFAVRFLQHPAGDVLLAGIDDDVCSHPFREGEAFGIDVRGDDLRRTGGPRNADGKAADRAAPDDQHDASRDLRGEHGVECVAHRVHDGADVRWDSVQGQHIGGGHDDEFGEGAVAVDPDDLGAAADVTVSGAALQAVPAHDVPLRGHELPGFDFRHAVSYRRPRPRTRPTTSGGLIRCCAHEFQSAMWEIGTAHAGGRTAIGPRPDRGTAGRS